MDNNPLGLLTESDTAQLIENASRLSAVFQQYVPHTTPRVAGADDWTPYALACLSRCHYTTNSILALQHREVDATCLARILFEHVVAFSWLMINPYEHHRQLLKSELEQRRKMINDFTKHAEIPLDRQQLEGITAELTAASGAKEAPALPDQALAADRHWNAALPEKTFAFRRTYANLWRPANAQVHPSWTGLQAFLSIEGDNVRVGHPQLLHGTHLPAAAVSLFCDVLVVAAQSLGWPPKEKVMAAFTAGLAGVDDDD